MKSIKAILAILTLSVAAASWAGYCGVRPELTQSERAEVRGIHNAFTAQARELRGELLDSRARLDAALSDEKTTVGELRDIREERRALRQELRELRRDEKREVARVAGANFTGRGKMRAFKRGECFEGPAMGRHNGQRNMMRDGYLCENFGEPMMPRHRGEYGMRGGNGPRCR
ncbi:MAG: hypothetical protein C0608_03205 [Deltaproteobacteria bacterium]|mgnify:CR=1 FL=1|nr:MAG: hypothetical protein C0608_03205 [Deltaproteobacteria bacterium]